MKKIIGILIIVAVVVVLIVLGKKSQAPESPKGSEVIVEEPTEENVAPEVVENELEGIELGDIEGELSDIDKELENL